MINERLKFYADTPRGERNKLFCWNVSILHLEEALYRFFAKGFVIRAAWYETINTETGVHENSRINHQQVFDKFSALPYKEKRRCLNVQLKSNLINESEDTDLK